MEKTIEIPVGYEARIEGNKVILEPKESEDERIRKMLIDIYTRADMGGEIFGKGITYKQVIAWLEKQGEQKKKQYQIYESTKDRFYKEGVEDGILIGKKQNPAWSEEDEKNIEKLGGFLTEVFCYGHVYVSQKDKEELQSWLKSLKERYTWKPSDEQMSVLFLYSEQNNTDGSVLRELYNDIKKLKG